MTDRAEIRHSHSQKPFRPSALHPCLCAKRQSLRFRHLLQYGNISTHWICLEPTEYCVQLVSYVCLCSYVPWHAFLSSLFSFALIACHSLDLQCWLFASSSNPPQIHNRSTIPSSLTVTSPPEFVTLTNKDSIAPFIFPDGIKTSGQHPPNYEELKPYSEFPSRITGHTLWKAADFEHHPKRWTHHFTIDEISELSAAVDAFRATGTPLTGITKENFPLPYLSGYLDSVRDELLNGRGFILFKNFPVQEWGNHKSAIAYMGLGTYLGYFLSQNGKGHVLGHVKDLGEDPRQIDKVRIYRTNARQYFHTDWSDIVGLLCLARALEGGESDICSFHHVYNVLKAERPDVVETLTKPIWYFDRKGEVSKGEEPYIRTSVFYLEQDPHGASRVYCKWDPYFVRSLSRFSNEGVIPPLSPEQLTAASVLEETCQRLSLHMVLEVGDIQFLSNAHILHARTAYKDHPPPAPRRHLMRLWLSTPTAEGGWRLPFADREEKRRGGIQVDEVPAAAELDAS